VGSDTSSASTKAMPARVNGARISHERRLRKDRTGLEKEQIQTESASAQQDVVGARLNSRADATSGVRKREPASSKDGRQRLWSKVKFGPAQLSQQDDNHSFRINACVCNIVPMEAPNKVREVRITVFGSTPFRVAM
jgi:hypothetical protein